MTPLPASFDREREFPILNSWDFFNHAGVSPISQRVADALQKYTHEALHDAYLTGNWYDQAHDVRKLAARLINAEASEIAFIKNTSEGLAFVANGLDWHAGDEIVSAQGEFPSNVYPWMDLAQRCGVRHIMVPEKNGRVEQDDLFNACSPKTRMIALSHVEFGSGFCNDLAAIGKFCRERRILLCVDAIQSCGVLPVDVRAMEIDFLSTSGHKWLMSPEGFGFFFCRKSLITSLRPEVGGNNVVNPLEYGRYEFILRSDARRFECGGPNNAGTLALGAALKLALEVGVETIRARVIELTDHLCARLEEKGYQVYSSRLPGEKSGIVAFTSPKEEPKAIVNRLMDKKIVTVPRLGRVRVAPHYYNSIEQIERLIAAL
ncbi:MAG TPA: aminotransferase class V-fold PLP-dependent enzyme [Planctomycetota bacterium]|nr:aminotransferase class V-fold PLP-dependent enzyme [Planctomycetota bacterium]